MDHRLGNNHSRQSSPCVWGGRGGGGAVDEVIGGVHTAQARLNFPLPMGRHEAQKRTVFGEGMRWRARKLHTARCNSRHNYVTHHFLRNAPANSRSLMSI